MDEREFVEEAKQRCRCVISNIEGLPDATNITHSCRRTLLKLALNELSFLSRCSPSLNPSVNIGHLEAVVHILQQPFVSGVSRVCKPLPLSAATRNGKNNSCSGTVHVDIVCTLNRKPVWIIVSNRNPKYVSWKGCHKSKGLKLRIEQVLMAACSSITLKPSSIILFFSNGLDSFVHQKLQDEYGATEVGLEFSDFDFNFSEELEGDWINVLARSYREACALEIKTDHIRTAVSSSEFGIRDSLLGAAQRELPEEHKKMNSSDSFCSLILGMELCSDVTKLESAKVRDLLGEGDLINFDTTALIAIVSGISNGGTEKLLAEPERELRQRFKGNFEFVIAQVMSEIQNPIHAEMGGLISGKRGIICVSVRSEFMELVLMCGGPNEKFRADQLMKYLLVVPDSPTERMMGLPTTRKLALKNKIVFGTGDYWRAPTLTANMAFVRAISQIGMSLFTIEHRPRALTGD